jgi:hypothetical protein
METLIIESEGATLEKIKAYLSELKVSFKSKKIKEKPYNPEFVKMLLERSENAKNGNTVPYTEELRKELFGDL